MPSIALPQKPAAAAMVQSTFVRWSENRRPSSEVANNNNRLPQLGFAGLQSRVISRGDLVHGETHTGDTRDGFTRKYDGSLWRGAKNNLVL